jgi:hypothetical protein
MIYHMFYGDYRLGENPQTFLNNFEEGLANLLHLSESGKCQCFYNHCGLGFEAKEWYENLESDSPEVVTSWSTLCKHFRVKWLRANMNILLKIPENKISINDAATMITHKTTTTTTTTTDSNNTMTMMIEQQDNKESTAGEEEEQEGGIGKQDKVSE